MTSILDSVKKVLGLDAGYTAFDEDVLMHINSIFMVLHQLGVGPDPPVLIENANTTWDQIFGTRTDLSAIKTYIYLRVRILFDPPTSSYVLTELKKQYEELEWRLNVQVDPYEIEGGDLVDGDT